MKRVHTVRVWVEVQVLAEETDEAEAQALVIVREQVSEGGLNPDTLKAAVFGIRDVKSRDL